MNNRDRKSGSTGLQVMWFKRDLRVQDNAALSAAAAAGPVLPLYVVEPELWRQPEASGRHWAFLAECLEGLSEDLARLGQPLVVRTGDIVDVLAAIDARHGIAALYSHEETGGAWTFARDRRVAVWCRAQGIAWNEFRQHGVERGRSTRDGWAARWDAQMRGPLVPEVALGPLDGIDPGGIPRASDLGLAADPCPGRQAGGRAAGLERLDSFLTRRGIGYRREMSSPVTGARACSRLSPHIALGTLSLREITQATWARQRDVASAGPEGRDWRPSLSSFTGRLHWHCHFIQKLEDRPDLETVNMHRAYDDLRPSEPDTARLDAWSKGETGLPFVDACMRALLATGWLNFRMRAMLMAVASYHLWLDWRAPGLHLARCFTDYEPGIHWPQVQMQSGTTGINTHRIYNPVKQGKDQDPQGKFVRKWVPELRDIPDRHIQEPWLAENAGAVLGRRYPFPILDHLEAARLARQKVWAVRKSPGFRDEAAGLAAKHGSRKRPRRRAGSRATAQMSLPFAGPDGP
ncbi:FAD-binding domain-containing protein [Tropicimonas sediminicola]|uniref:Deoxyribodipyrimidine photo-lyase family protein (Cryptochrome) n=1 Tax=Tropicimonas sediminicola TaxID=1031541 RepID=A0A239CB95_9RHOB|nr:deoxyribodipyrimidine photo-lyase [Tropicimonas sediminicola]SNS17360.1 deoxyribodipyrimidine photo-lyase family protein (cryptochrome) [Tropicimonas sediminicola]